MKNTDTVVVFIHGILESPNQFIDMKKAISKKYDCDLLLLPGHGKTGKDFGYSSMEMWKSYVNEKIENYRENYNNIFIVAHSMGCLFAISEAVKNPKNIKGLFLIASPFDIHVNSRGIKNGIRVAFNISKKDTEFCRLIKSVYSVSECKLSDYPLWIPRYQELFSESKRVCEILPNLKVPAYYVFSQKDEFVSIDSVNSLSRCKNYKLMILSYSGHFYYVAPERAKMLNEFVKFIKNESVVNA